MANAAEGMQTYQVQATVLYHDDRPTKAERATITDCQPAWFIAEMAKYSPVHVCPPRDEAEMVTVDLLHPGFTHRFCFRPIEGAQ